jgi:hypothetical protein
MEPLYSYYLLGYSDIVRNGRKSIQHPKASLSEHVILLGKEELRKRRENMRDVCLAFHDNSSD